MAVETLSQRTPALSVALDRAANHEHIRDKRSDDIPTIPKRRFLSNEERAEEREELSRVSKAMIDRGEYQEALQLVVAARMRYEAEQDRSLLANSLHMEALCYRNLNQLEIALEKNRESYAIYLTLDQPIGTANSLFAQFNILWHVRRDAEAIECIEKSRAIYREHGRRLWEMRATMSLSFVHMQNGDAATARELLFECLAFFEEEKSEYDIAAVLINITNTYVLTREADEAIRYGERGIALLEKQTNKPEDDIVVARSIVGGAYRERKDYAAALEHYQKALPIAERVATPASFAIILSDIAEVMLHMKRLDAARDMLDRSLRLNDRGGDQILYSSVLEKYGRLFSDPEYAEYDLDRALGYLIEARQLVGEQSGSTVLEEILNTTVNVYKQKGDFEKALEAFAAYHEVYKVIFNKESDQRVKLLETRSAVEKAQKDAEIAHLRSVELATALEEAHRLRAIADAHARTDILTGVENRRALEERVAQEFARACRNRQPLTIALIDIDHFKKINDTYGHAVGDSALRHLTAVLRSQSRMGDYVARYGGEEFALLFPETDHATALEICERLRAWVAASAWNSVHPGLHKVTMSVGLSTFTGDSKSRESLFAEADANLYRAKQRGRNRVVGNT